MAPGRAFMPQKVPTVRVVSVWPKPSMMERPVASRKMRCTSGFRASPAVVMLRMELRLYWEISSRISMRSMVGGAQKVVI